MSKVSFRIIPTLNTCNENLKEGVIGWIEYHLHKDNSWIVNPFTSIKDMHSKIRELKNEGYDYDLITYFEVTKYRLENPHLSAKEHFQYLIDYLHNNLT